MNETVQAIILAYEDRAIEAVMDTVAWLDLRTPAGKGGVSADKLKFRALATRGGTM